MDEPDANSTAAGLATHIARNIVASTGQTNYASGSSSVKRLPSQTSGHPLTISTVVPGRYVPVSRISTLSGSGPAVYTVKRPFSSDYSCDLNAVRKFPRSADKSKGLRHFSTKVCEKVKEKGHTNYNEVADELVAEYFDSADVPPADTEKQQYDMKNIRRRVYDALNVLMAMNIIEKEKKEIRWVGLPTSSLQECRKLEEEKAKRQERIQRKTEQLQDLIIQLVAYKSLVERNRELERQEGRPREDAILYLPFIIINTAKKTFIDCAISHDKTEYLFNFDQPFEIHDDIEVLKRLGLAHGLERGEVNTVDLEKIKSYLPLALRDYVDQMVDGTWNNAACDNTSSTGEVVSTAQDNKQIMYAATPRRHGSPALSVRQSAANVPSGYQQQKRSTPSAARVVQPVLPRSASAGMTPMRAGHSSNFIVSSSNGYRGAVTSAQHYTIQQGTSSAQQRVFSTNRQTSYAIQGSSGQSQLSQEQQYEEGYEDEEENLGYE